MDAWEVIIWSKFFFCLFFSIPSCKFLVSPHCRWCRWHHHRCYLSPFFSFFGHLIYATATVMFSSDLPPPPPRHHLCQKMESTILTSISHVTVPPFEHLSLIPPRFPFHPKLDLKPKKADLNEGWRRIHKGGIKWKWGRKVQSIDGGWRRR